MRNIDKPVLEYIISVCASAIKSESYISSQACSTIDNLISFVIKQGSKPHYLSARFSEMENVIHMLHVAIWEVVLLNEPENLWSLSRPLFPLILIDQAFFSQYAEMLCANQPLEHRQKLTAGLMSLMDGVQGTLTPKNRDRFTQNVQNFRRDLSNEHIVLS
jgi:exportin-7